MLITKPASAEALVARPICKLASCVAVRYCPASPTHVAFERGIAAGFTRNRNESNSCLDDWSVCVVGLQDYVAKGGGSAARPMKMSADHHTHAPLGAPHYVLDLPFEI